ncbi:hypothetical protein AGR7A_pAt30029 [Agrobacterium deltaense NCPPB 1641]|uniref:Uncharacterized protein n=1 Tax=Agrobacterium deltaense NCPPB 1641 TaxID=1183425 RepID=A0A1S7UAH5_9HYPH|nr:hypothetical protein AGR7A_pAt30029 [Agrobacterium deltaense NCPPB 1641]
MPTGWLCLPLPQSKLPVDAHLAFNIALALAAWPFSRLIARWMTILIPDLSQAENGPKFLDVDELSTPSWPSPALHARCLVSEI